MALESLGTRTQTDRDLGESPNRTHIATDFLPLFKGYGAAAGVDAVSITSRHRPGGRLAQLVRALP